MLYRVKRLGAEMKQCSKCHKPKNAVEFQDREDGWGTYAWCNKCRAKEGRDKPTPKQQKFVEKTRLFLLRPEYV